MKEPFTKYIQSQLEPNFLLIACGLPGTWKTETTAEVARITGLPLLRSDLIRLEVLAGEDIFDERVASSMDKRNLVYDEMFRRADACLETSDGVILDATFVTQSLRRQAAAITAKYHRTLIILQTDCPQEVALARILRRTKEDYQSNALTEQAYLNNQKKFEPVDLEEIKCQYPGLDIIHLIVDTRHDQPADWDVTGIARK